MMADTRIERRKFPRRLVRLSCHLQLGSGVQVHGNTHDISQEGASVETQPLANHQQNITPKAGDLGMLILRYNNRGAPDSMKVHSRIVHTQANRIGLYLFYSRLSELDKQNMDMILETGLDNI
jgi:hypothetical protein